MALREVVAERILKKIIGSVCKKGEWKVLVLDHLATRIISSCCRMHEIMENGITIVESLEKEREPLPHLEAIYIMLPTEQNVSRLIDDFDRSSEPKNLYRKVHLFLLQKSPPSNFSRISSSNVCNFVTTLQEANLAFLPYESQVYTLDFPEAFENYYCNVYIRKDELLERMADQLATVCALLGEYPAIRYWRDGGGRCADLASKLQDKLDVYKGENTDLGKGAKQTSEFIIVDRGFDAKSPVLHELTFQCMVYDLLKPNNDIYTFKSSTGDGGSREKKVILDDNDELWTTFRHMHIADASSQLATKFKEFAAKKKLTAPTDPEISVKDLGRHIKRLPQYQKELGQYSLHLNLIDKCMSLYKEGIGALCRVEQDLATGLDKDSESIDDPLKIMMASIFDRKVSVYDKIRLLVLYILLKKGVSREDFDRMMQHSEIPMQERTTVVNLMHLGIPIIKGESVKEGKQMPCKIREEETYVESRWTPLIKDILENCAEGKLDDSYCPYLKSKPRASGNPTSYTSTSSAASSVRKRYDWIPKDSKPTGASATAGSKKDVPTIFVFIIGGVTYSETRAVYEVMKKHSNHEFIVGEHI